MDAGCNYRNTVRETQTAFNPLWKNFSKLKQKPTTQSPAQCAKGRNPPFLRLNSTGEQERGFSKPPFLKSSCGLPLQTRRTASHTSVLLSGNNTSTGRSFNSASPTVGLRSDNCQSSSGSIASDIIHFMSSSPRKSSSSSTDMAVSQASVSNCTTFSQPQKIPTGASRRLCEASCSVLKGLVSPGNNTSHHKMPESSHFRTSVQMHSTIPQLPCGNNPTSYKNAVITTPRPPAPEHEGTSGELFQQLLSNLTILAPPSAEMPKSQKNSECKPKSTSMVHDPCKSPNVKEDPTKHLGTKETAAAFEEGPHFTKLEHHTKTFPVYEKPQHEKPKKNKKKKKAKFHDLQKAYGHVDIQETTNENGDSQFVVHGIFSVDGCEFDSSNEKPSKTSCNSECAMCHTSPCQCLSSADFSVTGSLDEATGAFVVTVSDNQESPKKGECSNSAIQFILGGGSSSGPEWDEEVDWSDCSDDETDAAINQSLLEQFVTPCLSISISTDFRKCHSDPNLSPRVRTSSGTSVSSDDFALLGEFCFSDAVLPVPVKGETSEQKDEEEAELLDRPRVVRFDPMVVVHELEPEDRTNTMMLDKQRFRARIERFGKELSCIFCPVHRERIYESRFGSCESEVKE